MSKEDDSSNSPNGNSPNYRSGSWLRRKHHEDRLWPEEIAELEGVSHHTIRKWMDKREVDLLPRGAETYRNEDWLRQKYWVENNRLEDLSDLAGVSISTIRRSMDKLGIDRRDTNGSEKGAVYKDPDWLFQKYHIDRLSCSEIGELVGKDPTTIGYHMDKHGIDRIPMGPGVSEPFLRTDPQGYVLICHSYRGEEFRVNHSRLLAVAKFGFESVCDKDVHHVDRVRWNDQFDNISLMTKEDHGRYHALEYWGGRSDV